MSASSIAIDMASRTVRISRTYQARVDRAWWAWTDPDAIATWWGPTGWTATVYEMDVRPGGRWLFQIAPDDGSTAPVRGVATYTVVNTGCELGFDDAYANDRWEPDGTDSFPTTVRFTSLGDRCHVDVEASFSDGGALRRAVEMHMADGYSEALRRLAHLLTPSEET